MTACPLPPMPPLPGYYYSTTAPMNARPTIASVAIIIIGWNCERYLAPCLDSVLNQTHRAEEIVFVDDASTDGTLNVARQFEADGLRVIERARNGGMCAARMTGVEATKSTLLLFIDGDDVLPPDFLEQSLKDLGTHDFLACQRLFFGSAAALQRYRRTYPGLKASPMEPGNRATLWRQNSVPTCGLMRRAAFLAAGGWIETTAGTMPDWHLFLRMSGRGSWGETQATLHYRRHAENWSLCQKIEQRPVRELVRRVRTEAATITVACVYSGRMPGLWETWLGALSDSLNLAGKTAELLVLDAAPMRAAVAMPTPTFEHVQVRRVSGIDALTRRKDAVATSEFLAGACNEIMQRASGDIVWFVEDDTVVPLNAASDLLDAMMDTHPRGPVPCVAGLYRNRHHPDTFVASNLDASGRKVVALREVPPDNVPVQLTGTGCCMVLRDAVQGIRFDAEWNHNGLRSRAHDWTFHWRLHERGMPTLLVPSVLCRHHQTEEAWV